MAIIVSDTFTDVDDKLLTAHASDVGPAGNWVQSGNPLSYGIRTNRARVISGTGFAIATRESGISNFTLDCDFIWKSGEAGGVVFRTDGTTNNRWTFSFVETGANIRLEKTTAGSSSSTSAAFTPVNGTTYHLKVVCTATDTKCYIDGVLKFTSTDTAFSTNTKHGLTVYSPGTPTVEWDNFTVSDSAPAGTAYTQTVGGASITPSGLLGRGLRVNKTVGGATITPFASTGQTLAGLAVAAGGAILQPMGSLVKRIHKGVGGIVTPVGNGAKRLFKTVGNGIVTSTGKVNTLLPSTVQYYLSKAAERVKQVARVLLRLR